MAYTSILKLMSDTPLWHSKGLVLTHSKDLNSEMSFLVSSPLEAVDNLALCDYKAQEEICILYIPKFHFFFYTQNGYTLLKTSRRFQSRENKGPSSSLVPILVFSGHYSQNNWSWCSSTTGRKNYHLMLWRKRGSFFLIFYQNSSNELRVYVH